MKSDCKALSAVSVEEVEDVDEDGLPLEPCSDSTAANRSCINFLNACRMLRGDSVVPVDEVELVEEVDSVVPVDEVEPVEVAFAFQFGCGPFGEKGVEMPIWSNACMMLCINVLFPPDFDRSPGTGAPELISLLFDCCTAEKSTG